MQKFNPDSNPQVTEALESAIEFQDAGRYPEAEEFYLAILRDEPLHPLANHNMGQLVLHGKYPASSLSYFLAALESDPANCRYWAAYIGALIRLGSMSLAGEALSLARQQGLQGSELDAVAVRLEGAGALPVVAVSPDVLQACQEPDAESINELMRLFAQAEYAETVTLAKSMTEHCSLHGFGWKMLGAAYLQLGYVQDALQALQKAATFLPNDADLYSNLGLAFRASGRTGEAYASCQRSLQLRSDFAEGHNNLGILLHDLGRFDDACASYARAIRLKPDFAEAHNNLGNSTRELGRLVEAEASYRQALRFKPDYAEAYSNLALTLRESGRLNEAQACLMLALQIRPDYAEAYCNLAGVLMESCQLNAAAENLRRALLIRPDSATLHSNLIFTLDMMTDMDITALQQERRAWNAMHAAHLLQRRPFATIPDPERRLRIGYVSADFRMHSAAFAFGAMLENFDHAKFEVLAYSNSVREDELTRLAKYRRTIGRCSRKYDQGR
jgi:protein O-GlcNAc transferase